MSGGVTFTAPSSLDGVRADRAIAILTDMSRSEIVRLIAAGGLRVNGSVVGAPSRRVREGEQIEIAVTPASTASPIEPDSTVPVVALYEDADLVVVDKPAGLVVHPGAGTSSGTLANGLVARYPQIVALPESGAGVRERPGIVHRLDKGTSGLMVVALSERAFYGLTAMIAEREVHRTYRALVWGLVIDDEAVIDAPVGRSARDRTLMAVSRAGKPALTRFHVDERFDTPVTATLLTVRLESGRTHQIRVHLSALGHPVVGDSRYGGGITRRRDPAGALALDRPFLHSSELSFAHPVSGNGLSFASQLPPDLARFLGTLRSSSRG